MVKESVTEFNLARVELNKMTNIAECYKDQVEELFPCKEMLQTVQEECQKLVNRLERHKKRDVRKMI